MSETVTPQRKLGSKDGMGLVGWAIAIPIALILLPLLPIFLLIKLIDMLFGSDEPR
jgi:hypothetical protein